MSRAGSVLRASTLPLSQTGRQMPTTSWAPSLSVSHHSALKASSALRYDYALHRIFSTHPQPELAQSKASDPSSFPRSAAPSRHLNHPHSTRPQSQPQRPASNPDRGPVSNEDTQTDFEALNVLSAGPSPATAIDACTSDGFMLDSGLRVGEGDGLILVGTEAFVWRPWMTRPILGQTGIVTGEMLRSRAPDRWKQEKQSQTPRQSSGGVINELGQFEVPQGGWGLLDLMWPKPGRLLRCRPKFRAISCFVHLRTSYHEKLLFSPSNL